MVNSCNSRSPILLDTPEGASANPVIEINDSGGHSRHHVRRRRHDSTEDVIIADSPKRARMDVPVIDLTSDNEEDYPTTENDTERYCTVQDNSFIPIYGSAGVTVVVCTCLSPL